MQIHLVPNNSIKPSDWSANYVLKPERNLLRLSMLESGWLQPLVVRRETMTIIDGFHRWQLAQTEDKFIKKHGDLVPVVFKDVDEIEAMVLHIRLNRSRGDLSAFLVSKIIKRIIDSGKYEEEDLSNIFLMNDDEIDLMLSHGLLKRKNLAKYEYSRAWVPIEVPKATEIAPVLERPPNPDR